MASTATDSLPQRALLYATGGPNVSDDVRKDIRTGWLFGISFLVLSSIHAATTSSNLGWGRRILYSLGAGVLGGLLGRTRDKWNGFETWLKGTSKPFPPLTDQTKITELEAKRALATNYPKFDGSSDLGVALSTPLDVQGDAPFLLLSNTKDYSFKAKDPTQLTVSFYIVGGDTVVCFTPTDQFKGKNIHDAIIATHNSAAQAEAQRFEFTVNLSPRSAG